MKKWLNILNNQTVFGDKPDENWVEIPIDDFEYSFKDGEAIIDKNKTVDKFERLINERKKEVAYEKMYQTFLDAEKGIEDGLKKELTKDELTKEKVNDIKSKIIKWEIENEKN